VSLPRRPQEPGPPSSARQFLYLDTKLTSELLAGLELGVVVGREHVTTDEEGERRLGLKVGATVMGAGVGVEGGKTTSLARRSEADRQQTAESEFSRLVAALRDRRALTRVAAADRAALDGLQPGDVLEIVGSLTISDSLGLGTAVASLQLAHGLFRRLGGFTVGAYNALRAVPGLPVDPKVSATSPGAGDVRFGGRIDARGLRTRLGEGELHGTVLAKLDRPLDGEASITVIGIYR
jgi:hypothetical protein